jgi:hypothetical protein
MKVTVSLQEETNGHGFIALSVEVWHLLNQEDAVLVHEDEGNQL